VYSDGQVFSDWVQEHFMTVTSSSNHFFSWRSAGAVAALAATLAAAAACGRPASGEPKTADAKAADSTAAAAAATVDVTTLAVVEQAITRTLRVTGSLIADEQAEVSAETAGRVVKTPVERGSRVGQGDLLIQLSTEQTVAQAKEAEANEAGIVAKLALNERADFDVERVPDVANAKANLVLADANYARFKSLLDQRVVSQAEYDQQNSVVEAARQKYESERNKARSDFRSLEAARARVTLARKSLADTTIRAPFAGEVAERKVSVGDFVNTGTAVVTVVRINPLRVLLTVPEQSVGLIKTGQPLTLQVDAYPDRKFTGTVRYISPSLRAEQRALTVEAVVPNAAGDLKPGFFATAFVEQPTRTPAVLVDRRAVREVGSTRRVFVVKGDKVEERIVTLGQIVDSLVEVVAGLKAGEQVATADAALRDGAHVRVARAEAPAASTAPASAPRQVAQR
jgi:RND family efflux transporter MFP subunit